MSEGIPQSHTEKKENLEAIIDDKVNLLVRFNNFIAEPKNMQEISAAELEAHLNLELQEYISEN